MKHAAISFALRIILSFSARRSGVRRHLPDFEGQAIALKLTGIDKPFNVEVMNSRFIIGGDIKPGAEIEGDLKSVLDILFGRLDYDAAYFRRRISFHGSLPAAMRFKALFDHITF
jgi:predicted lipid carrier protein YhbT